MTTEKALQTLRWVFTIPGMPFLGNTLETESLGGSESAALYLGRELARLGDKVFMFTAAEQAGAFDDVQYMPGSQFKQFAISNPHDVCVIQRAPEAFGYPVASRLNILWQHDMTLGRQRPTFAGSLWNIDRVALLSQYMIDHYKSIHSLDERFIFHTRNGIDLSEFEPHKGLPRDPYKLVYTSRPERGLDVMLEKILPALLARDPRYRLCIAGYDNKMHQLGEMYASIERLMRQHGDRVQWLGHLTHPELYEHYATAHLLVYPTPSPQHKVFDEISWISGMEAQSSGLPVVTSARGAITETVDPRAGSFIEVPEDGTASDGYVAAFVEAVESYRDPDRWRAASLRGLKVARYGERVTGKGLDWSEVARQWHDDAAVQISIRNQSPARLARHLARHSDIAALRELNRTEPTPLLKELIEPISWAFSSGLYEEHYSVPVSPDDLNGPDKPNIRLDRVADLIAANAKGEHIRILDVGCFDGYLAVILKARGVDFEYTGLDINPYAAEKALDTVVDCGIQGRIVTGGLDAVEDRGFDMAFAGEFLEHQPDPVVALSQLEAKVRPDGVVLLTTPFGPWEEHLKPSAREHLWDFEMHDIADMLAKKPQADVQTIVKATSHKTMSPCGWNIIAFPATHDDPVMPIDMSRKLRLQRPRETLSVNIIAGGPNVFSTARWCLDSVAPYADEIIIVDCGLEPGVRDMFESEYDARVIDSESPLEVGFETPRNLAIDASTCDWILWIDTDERLLNAPHMMKYLRSNCYAGYSIKQNHFAVDTDFSPDMPVRLFRRAGWDGDPIRFVGMIHEHPELGVNRGPGPVLILPEVQIAHIGYLTEEIRRGRFSRNNPLLLKDIERYPDRILQKHFIMRDNAIMINLALQKNGGQVTGEIRERCEENIALYHKYMVERNEYLHIDPTPYLAQALRVVNRGVDFTFSLAAGRDGNDVPLNGSIATRFETAEDAIAEVSHRVRTTMAPFEAEIW